MPRIASSSGLSIGSIMILVVFVIMALWAYGKFFPEDIATGEREFKVPKDLDKTTFSLIKIMVVGALVIGAYALVMKLGGKPLSKKDAFTLILIGIALLLLWDKFIQPMFSGITTLNQLTLSVGKKIGMLKP